MSITKGSWSMVETNPEHWEIFDQHRNVIADILPRHYIGESHDNARLITKAPELLATLSQLEDIISGIEAECDNKGIDLNEARRWWVKANNLINTIIGG